MNPTRTHVVVVLVVLLLAVLARAAAAADYVWWEGEDAHAHNFNNTDFAPASLDRPGELSNGDWLNNGGTRQGAEVFATWRVSLPEAGDYHFYARKFWHHGPFRWRFDQDDWRTVGRVGLLDDVSLRKHVTATWVSLGTVELSAGQHVFEVRLLARAGESAVSAFDCFALTRQPWVPSGKLKPGQKTDRAMPGYWAFEPDPDRFDASPIDLRRLNDGIAGERGFLKRAGLDLVFENDGRPVRFWGVCTGANTVNMDAGSVDYLARKLAKAGVNLIRVHAGIFDRGAADPATVDHAYLRRLHYFVHAMKREGIYTALSIYFPLWFDVKPHYGLPGFEGIENKRPYTLLFYHPRMQEIYRSWARGLMTTVNPYTGLALADDPAVAVYEIINEDNYFFWTFQPGSNIPYECLQVLEADFGSWAAAKYGSLEQAAQAWSFPLDRDDFASGRAGLLPVWNLTGDGLAKQRKARQRAVDQAQFLTEHLRTFYEQMQDWLRQEVGVKCPIVATNWRTADAALLGALDKYTNAACDVMDRHGYWGPPHKTDRRYTVSVGDGYRDECALLVPEAIPVRELQYDGHPHMVSEYSFPMINRLRGDSVFLAAVYGALQGTDIFCFFAVGGPSWRHTLSKWPVMVPSVLGQFPAAALIYRRGDVQEAETVVRQVVSLANLYQLRGTGTADPQNIDDMRAAEIPAGETAAGAEVSRIDPLAYYVGRVVRTFSDDASRPIRVDLTPYVDRGAKTVRSLDGAAALDYGRGCATVNTSRAQAATGFLGKVGTIELDDVTIQSANEYGCIMVVSLDEEPITSAGRVLLQVMTEETNYGWKTTPDGDMLKVTDLGSPPINVKDIAGTVTITRPDAERLEVTALDANGYPMAREVKASAAAGRLTIALEPDVLYYVLSVE